MVYIEGGLINKPTSLIRQNIPIRQNIAEIQIGSQVVKYEYDQQSRKTRHKYKYGG
jgi:hypothetical protein